MSILFNNLKKLIPVTALLLGSSPDCNSVPAIPTPIKIIGDDGMEKWVKVIGDENGFSVYSCNDNKLLKRTRGIFENKDTSVSNTTIPNIAHRKASVKDGYIRISDYPTIGHQKALVILVEFSDCQFSTMENAHAYYEGMLNEPGFTHENGAHGSARDFYLDSSHGLFDPEFVVVGPVRLEGTVEDYGADLDNKLDPNSWKMVEEACLAVDNEIDFSEFDADNDGNVDSIYFFYAGFGEADSMMGNTIWPHNGLLADNWGINLVLDGKRINNYACSNEIRFNTAPLWQPVGIGTFVHEFGHVLGLVDHYDTTYESGRTGVNDWDTMAAGSYHDNQNSPVAFSSYERAVLGWIKPQDTNPRHSGILYLSPLSDNGSIPLKLTVPGTDDREFFFVEMRKKIGWDSFLPSEGLLVWHIYEDEYLWDKNKVNTDPVCQHIDLIEADGSENTATYYGDSFPGAGHVTSFTFNAWNGDEFFGFDHMEQNGDMMALLLSSSDFVPSSPDITLKNVHGTSFGISWENSADALEYLLDIRDADGESLPEYSGITIKTPEEMIIGGLQPMTTYLVDLKSVAGSYTSPPMPVAVTTGEMEFFESRPEGLNVSCSDNDNTFLVSWNPVKDADDYMVTLYSMEYRIDETVAYGFDEGMENLPYGWTVSSEKLSRSLFGQKTPAIQMSEDGDTMEFLYKDAVIKSLKFYHRSLNDNNTLIISAYDIEDSILQTFEIPASTSGKTESIIFPEATGKVIIKLARKSGYLVLDDVEIDILKLDCIDIPGYTDMSTSGATCLYIHGFIADETHRVGVTARKMTESSLRSDLIPITGNSGIFETTKELDINGDMSIFNLSGSRISTETVSPGIFIIVKDGTARKVIVR